MNLHSHRPCPVRRLLATPAELREQADLLMRESYTAELEGNDVLAERHKADSRRLMELAQRME
jgi:hypothetical protein